MTRWVDQENARRTESKKQTDHCSDHRRYYCGDDAVAVVLVSRADFSNRVDSGVKTVVVAARGEFDYRGRVLLFQLISNNLAFCGN